MCEAPFLPNALPKGLACCFLGFRPAQVVPTSPTLARPSLALRGAVTGQLDRWPLCSLPSQMPLHGPCRLPGTGYGRPCTVLLDARLQGLSCGSVSLRAQPWPGAFLCTYPLLLSLPLSVTNRGGPVAGDSLAGGPACPLSFGPPPRLRLRPSYHSAPRPTEAFPLLPGNWRPFQSQGRSRGDEVGKCRGCELCPHVAPSIHKAKPRIPLSCSVPSPGPGVWAAWGPGGREAAGPGSLSAPALST